MLEELALLDVSRLAAGDYLLVVRPEGVQLRRVRLVDPVGESWGSTFGRLDPVKGLRDSYEAKAGGAIAPGAVVVWHKPAGEQVRQDIDAAAARTFAEVAAAPASSVYEEAAAAAVSCAPAPPAMRSPVGAEPLGMGHEYETATTPASEPAAPPAEEKPKRTRKPGRPKSERKPDVFDEAMAAKAAAGDPVEQAIDEQVAAAARDPNAAGLSPEELGLPAALDEEPLRALLDTFGLLPQVRLDEIGAVCEADNSSRREQWGGSINAAQFEAMLGGSPSRRLVVEALLRLSPVGPQSRRHCFEVALAALRRIEAAKAAEPAS